MNRLKDEKSPYLLQHAQNPVDWYPWGTEAIQEAKLLNKPIFLSIGYSTCHWCHVMAHESFENNETAALMNEHYINIKVDREERPDLDAIYMTAVQLLTGAGGWPMSVWLTPDLKPFYGGTYFPPDDRYGRPGFPVVLKELARIWTEDSKRVLESSHEIMSFLEQQSQPPAAVDSAAMNADDIAQTAFTALVANYDPVYGGFGKAPKFPMPVYLNFLLSQAGKTRNTDALNMVLFTVKKMSAGGIYDQLGGGFSRYSTDEKWIVPHFEKMLYDNAQLISICADLYRQTADETIASLIRKTIDYVRRDLMHQNGAFFSAEDADSEGKEGEFYLWSLHQIHNALTPVEERVFVDRYGVTLDGNFFDPHTRETGKNILVQTMSLVDIASKNNLSETAALSALTSAEQKLFALRSVRPRPHRDDKVIAGWNGLMISALAKAGTALHEEAYFSLASRAVEFVESALYDRPEKTLYRRWRDGDRKIRAHQSDYALLIQGLLDLFEATGTVSLLTWATELQQQHDTLFLDEKNGGYFMTEPSQDLLIRLKEEHDGVIPSGNSIAIANGLRLSRLTASSAYADTAKKTWTYFSPLMRQQPMALLSSIIATANL